MSTEAGASTVQSKGKAVNVASQITVDKQQNSIGEQAKSVSINKKYIKQNQTIVHQHLVPTIPAASFVSKRIRISPGDNNTVWDDRAKCYLTEFDSARLTERINALWSNALGSSSIDDLHEAICVFKVRVWDEEAADSDLLALSNADLTHNVRMELGRARSYYKNGYLRHAKLQTHLVSLERDLDAFLNWIKLLPSNDHCVLGCESLSILLRAAGEGHRIDEVVFECLVKIAVLFSSATQYTQVYTSQRLSESLHEKSVDLFERIADLLKVLLNHTPKTKTGKKDAIGIIDKHYDSFANILSEVNIEAKTDNNMSKSKERSTANINYQAEQHIRRQCAIFLESLSSYPLSDPVTSNSFPGGRLHRSLGEAEASQQQGSSNKSDPNPIELASSLGHNRRLIEQELENCLSTTHLEPEEIRKLSLLNQPGPFQNWLKEESKATALLIHGRMASSNIHTPLSHLCARFFSAYADQPRAVALTYFCGLRADCRDRRAIGANAAGLVTELICQLLINPKVAFKFDLGFIKEGNCFKNIKKGKIGNLCDVFSTLITQLQQEKLILFCLVDSISYYETEERKKDTQTVLKMLAKLVIENCGKNRKKKGMHLVFKLLIVDAGRTSCAWKYFKTEQMVDMQQDADGGDENSFLLKTT